MHQLRFFLVATLLGAPAFAQEQAAAAPRIADNSFLVEEAYNQEAGVIQHIGMFRHAAGGGWMFAFTQEWPAFSQRHQLSYTVPIASTEAGTGVGDIAINYRMQAIGRDDERVWFSPRLSTVLPTGDVGAAQGAGGPGVQVNLPLSIELTNTLVTHWNAGFTTTRARSPLGTRRSLRSLNAAASTIWLVASTFNLMLESTWERAESFDALERTQTDERFVLMPGMRAAINLKSGMQIVPGIGVPFVRSGGRTDRDLVLYFSVEHFIR